MAKKHLFAILCISTAIFLAYSNSLNGTWAMDDIVTGRPVSLTDVKDFIGFRKVAYLTFAMNQFIAPFNPLNFRLLNILIHIMNAVLIYIISYKTTLFAITPWKENTHQNYLYTRSKFREGPLKKGKAPSPASLLKAEESGDQKIPFYTAVFSSVLFALHPININAVAYIVQRMASLATLFVLLSLLAYMTATNTADRRRSFLFYVISGLLILAGIFSKENAVMAVPLILLYDYVFLSRFSWNQFRKRMLVICGIGFFAIGLSFAILKMHGAFLDIVKFFFNPHQVLAGKGWMAADVYWTPLQHILTEFRVVSRYLFLIFVPLPQLFVFDWWGFPISHGLTQPITTLTSIIAILSLVTISIWKMKRYPMLCFGILWYFCAISLESFLALGSDLYFEHRNYLPVSGLFIGIAGQVAVSMRLRMSSKIALSGVILCGILLGILTFSRNSVWKDSITLWEDTLSKAPTNIRGMLALGNAYTQLSDFVHAEKYYRDVVKISAKEQRLGFLDDAAYSLGMLYLFNGNVEAANNLIVRYELSLESHRVNILKGFLMAARNDLDGALKAYREILPQTRGRDAVVLQSLMGDAYRRKGMWDDAIERYRHALARDPGFAPAYYGLGVVYISKRDLSRSYDYFQKALEIDPNNVLVLSDMADLLLIKKENPEEALRYAERAVSKSPPFYQPYLSMGNVLIVLGREGEAEFYYRQARENGLSDYFVPFSKARAYEMRGDREKARQQIAELRKFKNLPEQIQRIIGQ